MVSFKLDLKNFFVIFSGKADIQSFEMSTCTRFLTSFVELACSSALVKRKIGLYPSTNQREGRSFNQLGTIEKPNVTSRPAF